MHAKALKSYEVTIRWYCGNKTLTISGAETERVKGSLESMANSINNLELVKENKSFSPSSEGEQAMMSATRNTNKVGNSLKNDVYSIIVQLFKLKSEFERFQ